MSIETKKDKIIELLRQGIDKSAIARLLDTQYSYVWSVAKKLEKEIPHKRVQRDSISQQIRDLADNGYGRAHISKKLRIDYSFVHNVLKRYNQLREEDMHEGDQQKENCQTIETSK